MDGRWKVISPELASDWLVRSALPAFCDLGGFAEDAEWLRRLVPYQGHTPSGRLKGWKGAGRRVLAIEERVKDAYHALIHEAREAGRSLNANDLPELDPDARAEVRGVAVFARNAMLPSRVGWDAYRVFSTISRFAAHAGHFYGMDDEATETISQVWHEAWTAISDRARLSGLEAV
ncbi:hypothetical protein [Microbacterium sp. 179-I 3D4 NHS]|uniref:hypothetical protein n=1 Tax=Microbacterium sp. 179-I 3D4 NHS TaxID=3142381 RepID=UPI0039A1030A